MPLEADSPIENARTPLSYQRGATVRAVLPLCKTEGVMGVAFDMPDGTVLRLAVPLHSAQFLQGAISQYLPSDAHRG